MFFLTLYCGIAENSHWRYFFKVILVNTVHFPNWNTTLSQKIALNLCQFFCHFLSPSLLSLCPSENTDWESYELRKQIFFFFSFGTTLWAVSPSTALSPVSCTSQHRFLAPSATFAGWPLAAGAFQTFLGVHGPLSSPGLCSWSWADLQRDKEVQASACRNQKSCPEQKVAGARGGKL